MDGGDDCHWPGSAAPQGQHSQGCMPMISVIQGPASCSPAWPGRSFEFVTPQIFLYSFQVVMAREWNDVFLGRLEEFPGESTGCGCGPVEPLSFPPQTCVPFLTYLSPLAFPSSLLSEKSPSVAPGLPVAGGHSVGRPHTRGRVGSLALDLK